MIIMKFTKAELHVIYYVLTKEYGKGEKDSESLIPDSERDELLEKELDEFIHDEIGRIIEMMCGAF